MDAAKIAADLTGANRLKDVDKMVVITTREGRAYSGTIIAESQRQVTIRVVGQDAVVINK